METKFFDQVEELLSHLDYWKELDSDEEEERFKKNFTFFINDKEISIEQKPAKSLRSVGLSMWNSSLILSRYLEKLYKLNKSFFEDKRIIELGSGCGLVGITAGLLGGIVTLTDTPRIINQLRKNVDRNSIHAKHPFVTRELTWGKSAISTFNPPYDIILATDVIYERKMVKPFLKSAWKLSDENTLFLLFFQTHERDATEIFWKNIDQYFSFTRIISDFESNEELYILSLNKISKKDNLNIEQDSNYQADKNLA